MNSQYIFVILAVYLSLASMAVAIPVLENTNIKSDQQLNKDESENKDYIVLDLKNQLDSYKNQIGEENLLLIKRKVDQLASLKCEDQMQEVQLKDSSNGCYSSKNFERVHHIIAQGIDSFDVLCDNQLAGFGWTVFLQYVNRKQSIAMDEPQRIQGFGSFETDFYLGLQKLHHLTKSLGHELYIRIEMMDKTIKTIRNNYFKIAGIENNYNIIDLGAFSGSATQENLKLINDILVKGAAVDWGNLRSIKMLMRPADRPQSVKPKL